MGATKELFGQMRAQGMDIDNSGQLYQEPNKCKAYRCPAWGGEEGDWGCDEENCKDRVDCQYV